MSQIISMNRNIHPPVDDNEKHIYMCEILSKGGQMATDNLLE